MKLFLRKLQEGGAMPSDLAAPAEVDMGSQASQDPMEQLINMAVQALQTNDAQMAMQVCQMLVQLAQQGSQEAPAEEQPAEPVYRKGGVLVKRIRK